MSYKTGGFPFHIFFKNYYFLNWDKTGLEGNLSRCFTAEINYD